MALKRVCLLAMAALVPAGVHAEMYRCPPVPGGDAAVVTNLLDAEDARQRGCQPMKPRRSALDQPMRQPARSATPTEHAARAPAARPTAAAAPAAGEPVGEHRVAPQVQRHRDDQRREILEAELRKELDTATRVKTQLERAGADDASRQQTRAALARHVANVDALKQEIARIR
ncbi:hypothetical protein M8A51_23070 [Schlegelella sp. S2-27]|uniref:DUF4124 domain-containing protein n=1 Tax=Caldimonas mangrovi TaxID=2944811 RepID=A0ABT0YUJ7_9BURK|nr:hypothetical protein [Caldimonas mangrovi]MCM5682420.1 hypothetical protein [Caldimonas mangrovi]